MLSGEVEVPEGGFSFSGEELAEMEPRERAVVVSARVAQAISPAWRRSPGAVSWMLERWEEEVAEAALEALGSPEPASAEGGVDADPFAGEAALLFWREREAERPALGRFMDGAAGLVEDLAEEANGLSVERGTAPFPPWRPAGYAEPATDDPLGPTVSPLSYVQARGGAEAVAEVVEGLLEAGFAGFSVLCEEEAAAAAFRGFGVEAYVGSLGPDPDGTP
jgi:hypothetical protein